jgi:hypothetical protein
MRDWAIIFLICHTICGFLTLLMAAFQTEKVTKNEIDWTKKRRRKVKVFYQ